MNIILGVGTLVLVLIVMTLFLNFAPYGKQGLQALSGAACATFLPQAFLNYYQHLSQRTLFHSVLNLSRKKFQKGWT